MTRLCFALLAALLLALALTGWRGAQLREAQHASAALAADIASRDRVISHLREQAQINDIREAALRAQLGRASRLAVKREVQIARENYASQALRQWSAAALPDDVIRLHSRPAFDNARDYLDWLSASEQLSSAGQPPADAGRSGGR